MATGWLRGTVKAVPSGDSLLIMGNAKTGIPPEKTITLSSLIAPKLARKDSKDEPFAWDSRESLRKKCVGKEVVFKVDYIVPSINREFGSVFMGETNIALSVVSEGWAKVRPQVGQSTDVSPYLTELLQLEEQAREQGLGLWNKTPGGSEASIRDIPPSAIGDASSFDAAKLLESNKGKLLPAIVEHVRDGSTVRVSLLPEFQYVQVFVAGIQAPSMGRRPTVEAQSVDSATKTSDGELKSMEDLSVPVGSLTTAQKLAASVTAASTSEIPPEPLAREAKHYTEIRVLHRDVRIMLEGVDKFNNLIGSLSYVNGDVAVDLALELVKEGLAKVVEWSANMLEEEEKRRLKNAELQAKKDRLRIWTNYVPPASNSTAIRDGNFTGKVIEVVSGDCVVVADDAVPFGSPLAERRVNFSSIRAPKMGNPKKDEKPAPFAREAKEYLRSRLVGQQVNVVMEYSRKVSPADALVSGAPSSVDTRVMDFGSIFLLSPPKNEPLEAPQTLPVAGQPQGVNVAEMVVARGYANVVRHRDFEERSSYYDALLAAESRAIKGKKGIHSSKEPPVMHINDLSLQGTTQKAKQFLPFLQRAKRLPAVVDYVLSGHRFKLLIPKETCAIAFSLSGVRCPARNEPYADEALSFMRQKILQRDVEIEVETVDRTGTFLGTLWESKVNVGIALLEAGLAKLQSTISADRLIDGHLLAQAEQRAKKQCLKVWESYVEGQEELETSTENGSKSKQEVLQVRVTEVLGGGRLYAQIVGDSRVSAIQQQLESLRLKDKPLPPGSFLPKKGDFVIAQYSADDTWNRALVVSAPRQPITAGKAEYEVFYLDYGNQEIIPLSKLRPLDVSVGAAVQGLAQLCSLAYIKVPELEEDFGVEAAELLSASTIGDKKIMMKVEDKDLSGGKVKGQGTGTRLVVTLVDVETTRSINATLVEAGLARIEKKGKWDTKEKQTALENLADFQETARKARLNIWQYGDVESDDEDESLGRKGGRR
ncbi:hypothetical protein O6H91_01G085700 [Diphasiastrum complanatum]|uniref:Uncharacterized protein n=1 Tax=Diphasiastrum complanatum TaxID=34168 RepID=A0ACC2ET73_DIPCM|nr:hypothetical protein O6H91_01G085700 [Diphasiastrum complanatum]